MNPAAPPPVRRGVAAFLRFLAAAGLLSAGCSGEPAQPVTPPVAPAPTSTSTSTPSSAATPPPGPASAAAPAVAPAVAPTPGAHAAAPAAAGGLRADPTLVALIGTRTVGGEPTIDDPFLPSMTRQFNPAPHGAWATDPRVEAEVRRLAAPLVHGTGDARADAAYALAELGPAVAIHLDAAIRELRADATARVDAMLAQTVQRLAAAGLTPEQVQWDPQLGRYEPTITTLIRELIDGDATAQAQAAAALGELEPHIVWMFHERPVNQILMEPARAALLATQRRVWRTADVNRAAEWLALRLQATLWIDKAILNEPRAELRDRDYVDPKLVFDNLTGELLADYTTYGPPAQRGYVVWRPAVPPVKPGDPARPIGAELAGNTSVASAYRLVSDAGDFTIHLDPAIDGAQRARFAIRTFDWLLFLFELAGTLGHEVREHPDGGFLIVPKK